MTSGSSKYYLDVLTLPEIIWRGLLILGFFSLVHIPWAGQTYQTCSIAVSVVSVLLCLGWNDQYELSVNDGLVLSRTLFGKEFRIHKRALEELDSVGVKGKKVMVKTTFLYQIREVYQPFLRDRKGKSFPLGETYPPVPISINPNWEAARGQAAAAGRQIAQVLGLPFRD